MLFITNLAETLSTILTYTLASLAISVILYFTCWFFFKEKFSNTRALVHIARIIFFAYLLGIVLVGFSPYYSSKAYHNFIPFKSIAESLGTHVQEYRLNFMLSLFVFVPMGILLPIVSVKIDKIYKAVLFSFMICFAREVGQLILNYGRVFDIDALIICALFTAVGYGCYASIKRIISKVFYIDRVHK